jgi:translation elongation factor EF-Ts
VHTDGKQAALVEVQGSDSEAARQLARDIAMQAVALKAPYLNRDAVPADVVEGRESTSIASRPQVKASPKRCWTRSPKVA